MALETFIKFIKINFLLAYGQGFIREIFINLDGRIFILKLVGKGVDFVLQLFQNFEYFTLK